MKLSLEHHKLNYVTPDERIRDFHSQFICDNSLGTFEIVMEKVYTLLCCMCTAHCIYLLCTFCHCTCSYVHTVN